MGTMNVAPPAKWADNRFDVVWVFTRHGHGWRFSQIPQLLLDGDTKSPVA
ncbi:hypothetical protein GCM10029978_064770 [Actinoallomurus acanthiterrae]